MREIKKVSPSVGRVVILPDAPEEKTASGLYIPDTFKETPNIGTVTFSHEGNVYKVGDVVLFAKNAGMEVIVSGVAQIMLREGDVYGAI